MADSFGKDFVDPFLADFEDFYIKMSIINYKRITKSVPFSKEDKKFIEHIKVLLPIYYRLKNDESIDIDNLFDNNKKQKPKGQQQLNIMDDYPFNNINDFDKVDNISSESDEENTQEDPEGDQQVNDLTIKSLDELHKIKSLQWISTETYTDSEEDNHGESKSFKDNLLDNDSYYTYSTSNDTDDENNGTKSTDDDDLASPHNVRENVENNINKKSIPSYIS